MGHVGNQVREIVRSFQSELAKAAGQRSRPIFEIRPITNGFIVVYPDTEEFTVKAPDFSQPVPPPVPGQPRRYVPVPMADQRRWRIVWREVFCADAAAIQTQVEEALKITEKVKYLKAQDAIVGDAENEGEFLALGKVTA